MREDSPKGENDCEEGDIEFWLTLKMKVYCMICCSEEQPLALLDESSKNNIRRQIELFKIAYLNYPTL